VPDDLLCFRVPHGAGDEGGDRAAPRNVKQPNFVAYNLVDDINKKTYSIMKKDGVEAAANHMIKSANMDYAAMRSMYG